MKKADIAVVFVFDGEDYGPKTPTRERRDAKREKALAAIQEAKDQGREVDPELLRQTLRVTKEMRNVLVRFLTNIGHSFVIAAYEAEPQMAYMAATGQVDAVYTTDTDLIAFGCPVLLSNLDDSAMHFDVILYSDIVGPCSKRGKLDFTGWSEAEFLAFCVLCGCDYLPRIPLIGPSTAHKTIQWCRTHGGFSLPALFEKLNHRKKLPTGLPEGYADKHELATLAFIHPPVLMLNTEGKYELKRWHRWDPTVRLSPEQKEYIGPWDSLGDRHEMALGRQDPVSLLSPVQIYPQFQLSQRKTGSALLASEERLARISREEYAARNK
ncbi:PIN domain-like protein [Mycena galopus ATCC 62051]|nr:PIN domain-like protein [Mycena galopus ATCC 62051]